jgi:MYXO-CTERM domain-containing protein
MSRLPLVALALATLTTVALPREAAAFCGFYVAGADAALYNDATMVVLMRDGTRVVLSMQNAYQGPPEDFTMVVPVPVVLQEDDVKVLPANIFDRVDKLAAPRLVEYWEQDPCVPHADDGITVIAPQRFLNTYNDGLRARRHFGVTIEAQFEVGEYQIVILSAKESTGLEAWLRHEKYNIPAGAEPLLRPYVESGSKFFVAKVDAQKVQFEAREDGVRRAELSPLRFHYDSQEFSLPIRLGLINAAGPQDLLVHILARERYEVANYDNVAIPTNLDVEDQVRTGFGSFYASLFDHTLAHNPKAVVTEYAWGASSCDPCPEPALNLEDLVTLGADVLPSYKRMLGKREIDWRYTQTIPAEFVLTRLHARYDAGSLGEDLVFQAAPAIVGGREFLQRDGQLERGAIGSPGGYNNFQARYAIRHEWTGPIDCAEPQRGIWGEPWPELQDASGEPRVALDLAFVARDVELAGLLTEQAQLELEHTVGPLPRGPLETLPSHVAHGCAHCSVDSQGSGRALLGLGLLGLALGLLARRLGVIRVVERERP